MLARYKRQFIILLRNSQEGMAMRGDRNVQNPMFFVANTEERLGEDPPPRGPPRAGRAGGGGGGGGRPRRAACPGWLVLGWVVCRCSPPPPPPRGPSGGPRSTGICSTA